MQAQRTRPSGAPEEPTALAVDRRVLIAVGGGACPAQWMILASLLKIVTTGGNGREPGWAN